ncbi:MAG: hypothetical protein R2862_11585 [Thermoanaerobaculia bacterium]
MAASRGFRWIVLPGAVALWPLLLRRWMRGAPPPASRTRTAAPPGCAVIRALRRRRLAVWIALAQPCCRSSCSRRCASTGAPGADSRSMTPYAVPADDAAAAPH